MNKVNEEWQMKIFDLLEGNLSEKESKAVLNEIEKNHALKHEYDLLKQTYLTPSNITFEFKEKLYKRSGLFIIRPIFYRVAAAVAVIFVGSFSFYYFGHNNQISTTESTISSSNSVKPTLPDENIVDHKNNYSKNAIQVAPQKAKSANWADYIETDSVKKSNVENVKPNIEAPLFARDPEIHTPNLVQNTDDSAAAEDAIVLMPDSPLPVSRKKRKTLMYKLMNNSRTMLANLQLPDVSFKAIKNNNKPYPKIQMEIRTLKTDVIATLID